jgi:excinuclease ABC subunit A
VKLASELAKKATSHTIYILDEPTTGLHFEDIRKLLTVLSRLVDQGNTVLVIEHNLDVIKTADWLVDLGPEGGNKGGLVVAEGTPEDVVMVPESHTGRFLAPILEGRAVALAPSRSRASSAVAPGTGAKKPATKAAARKTTPKKTTVRKTVAKKTTSTPTARKTAPRRRAS